MKMSLPIALNGSRLSSQVHSGSKNLEMGQLMSAPYDRYTLLQCDLDADVL